MKKKFLLVVMLFVIEISDTKRECRYPKSLKKMCTDINNCDLWL